ncbi:calcium-binding protein [Providencia sp. PROV174]|uniref:calcium-binding protein n=1 Tax=Providencia sp. PROV174 TaxID=2949877 RepID=UPI00234B42ED|nr:calcium-binding protein [Providencia sp. PROV174]
MNAINKLKEVIHLNKTVVGLNYRDKGDVYINLMKENLELGEGKGHEVKLEYTNNVFFSGGIESNLFIKGNKNNNVLDAGVMKASINGYGGNDHIIFSSGVARGGDGDDNYYLRRYQWKNVKNKSITKLNARIVENTKDKSDVHLGYTLEEIVNVKRIDNDLVLTIKAKSPYKTLDVLELNITLKNAYQDTLNGKKLKHHYQLYTHDGFCLNPILNNNSDKKNLEKFYEITYLQDNDYLKRSDESDKVKINQEKQNIIINNHGYFSPSWGDFNFNGNIKNLTYTGSDHNDHLVMVNRNSYIIATKGNDIYQLKHSDLVPSELVIDLGNMKGNDGRKNSIIIKLPDEYEDQLRTDGQSIYVTNIFDDRKLDIKFVGYENNEFQHIYIKDANDNLIKINLNNEGHEIATKKITSLFTEQSDKFNLRRKGDYLEAIVDALDGDDSIYNHSGFGMIANGGNGNDKLIAYKGMNVLYGGSGNDVIDGGMQGDLLLSDLGDDILNGNDGNDHYIVDGSKGIGTTIINDNKGIGTTIINDNKGINNIHLMYFNKEYKEVEENGIKYQVFTSVSKLREVKIKKISSNEINKNHIHHYDRLPDNIPNDVKESMSHMVRYLAEQKKFWEREYPLIPWQPIFEFKGFFENTNYSIRDLSSLEINIKKDSKPFQLVMSLTGNQHKVVDKSKHGRVFKAKMDIGSVSVVHNNAGHNVLYAEEGNIDLSGGDGNDVLIANGHSGELSDQKGENTFIVNGEFVGKSIINHYSDKDTIHLISFNRTPEILEPDDRNEIARHVYSSESGYKVTLIQRKNNQAPVVVHHNSLPGTRKYTTAQKLDYLVNTLAEMRLQDEYNSVGTLDFERINSDWQPVQLVNDFLSKG